MDNYEFVQRLKNVLNYSTVYSPGTYGELITLELARLMTKTEEEAIALANQHIYQFHCGGLVLGILWGWGEDSMDPASTLCYCSNDVPILTPDTLAEQCADMTDDWSKSLDIGELVWKERSCGVYIGDGNIIYVSKCTDGVQITPLMNSPVMTRPWVKHGHLPYIIYNK